MAMYKIGGRAMELRTITKSIIGGPAMSVINASLRSSNRDDGGRIMCSFRLKEHNTRICAVITAATYENLAADNNIQLIEGYYAAASMQNVLDHDISYEETNCFMGRYDPDTQSGELALNVLVEAKKAVS